MDRYPSLINVTAKRVRVPGTPSGHTPQSKRPKNESLQVWCFNVTLHSSTFQKYSCMNE